MYLCADLFPKRTAIHTLKAMSPLLKFREGEAHSKRPVTKKNRFLAFFEPVQGPGPKVVRYVYACLLFPRFQGLAFRHNSRQMFSTSEDKTVKHWNLDDMCYVETLFGHQEAVLGVDALAQERCLTIGGSDRTLRLWKIPEESHLVFNGPK